jgi:hypothetical protein
MAKPAQPYEYGLISMVRQFSPDRGKLGLASASAVIMPRTVRPRRQRPDNQANIAILNERIATLEAELCAEQRQSAYYRADFDRERNRADCEGEHVDRQREHADRRTGCPTHLVGRS